MEVEDLSKGTAVKLVISAVSLDIRERHRVLTDQFKAMVDQGANVNLGPVRLAKALGLEIVPHTDGRKIGTADSEGQMEIVGWIFPGGFIGAIALVGKAAYTLLSVTELQKNWMGVHCPPGRSLCTITVMEEDREVVYIEIVQSAPTNLYFVDLRKLLDDYQPEYVQQPEDVLGAGTVMGGCAGTLEVTEKNNDEVSGEMSRSKHQPETAAPTVQRVSSMGGRSVSHAMPKPKTVHQGAPKKCLKTPTLDVAFRVWSQHLRMNHVSLLTMSDMIHHNTLHNTICTSAEIH
jgi:hypothetical protein